jgi:hypothetical protein
VLSSAVACWTLRNTTAGGDTPDLDGALDDALPVYGREGIQQRREPRVSPDDGCRRRVKNWPVPMSARICGWAVQRQGQALPARFDRGGRSFEGAEALGSALLAWRVAELDTAGEARS